MSTSAFISKSEQDQQKLLELQEEAQAEFNESNQKNSGLGAGTLAAAGGAIAFLTKGKAVKSAAKIGGLGAAISMVLTMVKANMSPEEWDTMMQPLSDSLQNICSRLGAPGETVMNGAAAVLQLDDNQLADSRARYSRPEEEKTDGILAQVGPENILEKVGSDLEQDLQARSIGGAKLSNSVVGGDVPLDHADTLAELARLKRTGMEPAAKKGPFLNV